MLTSILAFIGLMQDMAVIIIIAEVTLCISSAYIDIKKGYNNISFITFYSLFSLLYLIGNYFVVTTIGTPEEFIYNNYLVAKNIVTSALITYVGNACLVMGYESFQFNSQSIPPILRLHLDLSKSWITYLIVFAGFNLILQLFGYPNISTLSNFISSVIFIAVRYASSQNNKNLLRVSLLITIIATFYSLLYSYRRQGIFEPLFFYLIAYIIGYKSFRALTHSLLFPVYGMLLLAITAFTFLGNIRLSSGDQRWNQIINKYNSQFTINPNFQDNSNDVEEKGSFIARNSNLNQLTQVVKVAEEDGFYEGNTLQYMAYAFIPRFIWPDKPLIMQGRWFALRAGLAYQWGKDLTTVNNSINMTVAGELYLNFGFLGISLGMMLIGILMNYFWTLSQFWSSDSNILGSLWGAYLIVVALFYINVDLQFLVTTMSLLFSLVLINLLWKSFYPVSQN